MMIARDQTVAADAPAVDPTPTDSRVDDSLTKAQIFHLLRNDRRRLAMTYLREREGEVEMRAIAEQVAAWEHDTTVDGLDSDERQRVYIPLYQNHLPTLDEEGVIEYDQNRGTVERTPVADQLDPYLAADATPDDSDAQPVVPGRWHRYYLTASLASTGLIAGAALGIPLVEAIPALVVGMLVVLAFTAITIAQCAALELS